MKIFVLLLSCIIIYTGCSNERIEITSEYIINSNWGKNANAIKINKLRVKVDSTIDPFSEISQAELLDKLEKDTSFQFVANVKYNGEDYARRKVYFNKRNNFFWWTNKGDSTAVVVGDLQKNTWYQFSNLVTHPFFIYAYIDSLSQVHRFDINLANY